LGAERAAGPVRTCIGCRARDEVGNLVRVTAQGGICVVDRGRGTSGRGAYVHPRQECIDRVERTSILARALRVPGPISMDGVRTVVLQAPNAAGNRPR
jgi:predicted RNA-binding protein YlxR (DUF448 family)